MPESIATVIPSATQVLFQGQGWRMRPASTGDRAAIHEMLRTIPFGGPVNLSEDRGGVPGRLRVFEAEITAEDPELFLLEDDAGSPIGCLSIVVRPARLGTDLLSLGHISDLRIAPQYRGAKVLPIALQVACDEVRERLGAEIFYTACLDEDRQAFGAFTHRDDRRYQQPMAQVMQQQTIGLLPLKIRQRFQPTGRIEQGSEATLEEVSEFLARSHATSTFGQALSAAGFAARIHKATKGQLERILLVRDTRGGGLACCGVVMSTGSMRRFVLGRMQGGTASAARRFNLKRWTGGYPRLPIERGAQGLLQLAFVAQREDEAGPLRDLISAALTHPWGGDEQWLSVATPRQGQSARALSGLPSFELPISLMAVTRAGTRWNNVDFRTPRCGVEHLFF